MAKRKKKVKTLAEVERTCCFCGHKGHPHDPATEQSWFVSLCHSDLLAICPVCIRAGRRISEIIDAEEEAMEL